MFSLADVVLTDGAIIQAFPLENPTPDNMIVCIYLLASKLSV